jgi:hypothetical protein
MRIGQPDDLLTPLPSSQRSDIVFEPTKSEDSIDQSAFAARARISYLFPVFFSVIILNAGKRHSMKLPSAALALIAFLLVIGCAKEPPPTAAESALEKKDKHEYDSEVEGRIR